MIYIFIYKVSDKDMGILKKNFPDICFINNLLDNQPAEDVVQGNNLIVHSNHKNSHNFASYIVDFS